MNRVILETRYFDINEGVQEYNKKYASACLRHAMLVHNEAGYASHLLYTDFLDDKVPAERKLGIEGGFNWRDVAEKSVVYTDLGISSGMQWGMDDSILKNKPVEIRKLPPEDFAAFDRKYRHLKLGIKRTYKALAIISTQVDCYPSLQLTTIADEEAFQSFLDTLGVGRSELSFESLDGKTASYLQRLLNSGQEQQEFLVSLIDLGKDY
jgi:hypothetical protein